MKKEMKLQLPKDHPKVRDIQERLNKKLEENTETHTKKACGYQ